MKNENGTGSVYKLSGKRRKPWIARITTGYTLDGRQERFTVGTFTTKREAQEALFNYVKNPSYYTKITFGEVMKMWLDNYLKKELNEGTINNAKNRLKLFDSLLGIEMQNLKLQHLQDLMDNLNCSTGHKKNIKSTLNAIVDFAVKNDYIASNKVEYIEIGKHKAVIERKVFTKKEIDTLWAKCTNHSEKRYKFICSILILIYTGMRIGELLNLEVSDINLAEATLKVTNSKTSAGIRIIPINSKIIKLFQDNLKQNQTYFLENGKGAKLPYVTFKQNFKKVLKGIGLEEHTIHDTRHTFATLLNNADANQSSIIKLIGHSDFKTTENVYTHKSTEELRKAIELIN